MHPGLHRFLDEIVPAKIPCQRTRVVEIGSYDVNGSARDHFPQHLFDYTGVDIRPGPGVDVVADGRTWQPAERVDVVVCTEVIEHCDRVASLVANLLAMLRPGGVLIITGATPSRGRHGMDGGEVASGEFYEGVRLEDLLGMLRGVSEVHAFIGEEEGIYCWCRKE